MLQRCPIRNSLFLKLKRDTTTYIRPFSALKQHFGCGTLRSTPGGSYRPNLPRLLHTGSSRSWRDAVRERGAGVGFESLRGLQVPKSPPYGTLSWTAVHLHHKHISCVRENRRQFSSLCEK